MKKREFLKLLNLIFNSDENKTNILNLLEKISKEYRQSGDLELYNEIRKIVMSNRKITTNKINNFNESDDLVLSKELLDKTQLLITSLESSNLLVNKILFYGHPGTGKTILAQKIATLLKINIVNITYGTIVNSKLGESIKNLELIFEKYNGTKTIIFFDELDGFSANRSSTNDVGEMSRITTSLLIQLDKLSPETIFIASTNLRKNIDKAIMRRFDLLFNFDSYNKDDLEKIVDYYATKYNLNEEIANFKNILNDTNICMFPFEIKTLFKQILIRKNANYSVGKVYKDFLMDKLGKTENELIEYVVKNNSFKLVSASLFLDNNLSKSKISKIRREHET